MFHYGQGSQFQSLHRRMSDKWPFYINLPGVYIDLSLPFFVLWCYLQEPDFYFLSSLFCIISDNREEGFLPGLLRGAGWYFPIQLITPSTLIRIVRRARNGGINSATGILFWGFYHGMMIILSIRQIDNPFIPLSFHWSRLHIKPQTLFTIVISVCFYYTMSQDSGGEIASHPFQIQDPESGIIRHKFKSKN